MAKYKKIPVEVSIYLRYLHQDLGVRGRDLIKRFPEYPRRSVYWHANLPIEKSTLDKRKQNKGRPRIISERGVRHIENALKELRRNRWVFCFRDIQQLAGISETDVSNRTVRRCLNEKNYKYLQCRKKGLLTTEDMKSRLTFAKKVNRLLPKEFWQKGISFYIDGVGWGT